MVRIPLLKEKDLGYGRVLVIPSADINAFAIGKNIIFTKGMLDNFSDQAIKGAYYHELSHVRNKDQIVFLIVFLVSYMNILIISQISKHFVIPSFICFAIFLVWIRWQMELRADRESAMICGCCIVKALEEISKYRKSRKIIPFLPFSILHPPLSYRISLLQKGHWNSEG